MLETCKWEASQKSFPGNSRTRQYSEPRFHVFFRLLGHEFNFQSVHKQTCLLALLSRVICLNFFKVPTFAHIFGQAQKLEKKIGLEIGNRSRKRAHNSVKGISSIAAEDSTSPGVKCKSNTLILSLMTKIICICPDRHRVVRLLETPGNRA